MEEGHPNTLCTEVTDKRRHSTEIRVSRSRLNISGIFAFSIKEITCVLYFKFPEESKYILLSHQSRDGSKPTPKVAVKSIMIQSRKYANWSGFSSNSPQPAKNVC